MPLIFLQSLSDGWRIDPNILIAFIGAMTTTAASTIAVLYKGQIGALTDRIRWLEAELAKRDEREDRLIEQLGRTADGLHRAVELVQPEIGTPRVRR